MSSMDLVVRKPVAYSVRRLSAVPDASEEAPSPPASPSAATPSLRQQELALYEKHVEQAKQVNTTTGLTAAEAEALRAKWGFNELPEKEVNLVLLFLAYFTGPMPTMIWIAIIIELVKGILTGAGWEDFAVLVVLQFANAIVGFMEEKGAGDAIAALKSALKPIAYVLRDGHWDHVNSRLLVPGDVIEVKLGDVMAADCVLLASGSQLQMDQAALTGESLPVERAPWEKLLMGSVVKRGEAKAMVCETGLNTVFGKAAGLIAGVTSTGNLQKVLLKVTLVLSGISILMCAAIFVKLWYLQQNPLLIVDGAEKGPVLACLSITIVILVASIPIAIEVVCTSTLAVGSHRMSEMKVIVSRLSAIEELASMEILCSDKTGTLTQNKLSLYDPILTDAAAFSAEDLTLYAALASKKEEGSQDAIDLCIMHALSERAAAEVHGYTELEFIPFNPNDKRTLFRATDAKGAYVEAAKGAPHVILAMCHNAEAIRAHSEGAVQALADRGYRALGVAVNRAGQGAPPKWEHVGILSLYDPPRYDTAETIAAAHEYNIDVKMVTGDHTAIAVETSKALGLGTKILNTEALGSKINSKDPAVRKTVNEAIVNSHGFAEVMPEHKFLIVERIMEAGYTTGMTGDGVNDAPALKRADVGIAVEGATDAARAAADLVLIEPGLAVIIKAIFESRCIFQRMRNYIVYRIACTVQLLLFFFFAIMTMDPSSDFMYGAPVTTATVPPPAGAAPGTPPTLVTSGDGSNGLHCNAIGPVSYAGTIPGTELCHGPAFTLPVIAMVIITILNDGCMITISSDSVLPDKFPQKWNLLEVSVVALALGLVACLSSLILVAYLMHASARHPGDFLGLVFGSSGRNWLTWYEVRCILYLKVSVSDFLTLFSARTRGFFWERGMSTYLSIAAAVALTTSTLLALFWGDIFSGLEGAFMAGLRYSQGAVLATWLYCILWWLAQDAVKVGTYYLVDVFSPAGEWKAKQAAFVNRFHVPGSTPRASPREEAPLKPSAGGASPAAHH